MAIGRMIMRILVVLIALMDCGLAGLFIGVTGQVDGEANKRTCALITMMIFVNVVLLIVLAAGWI